MEDRAFAEHTDPVKALNGAADVPIRVCLDMMLRGFQRYAEPKLLGLRCRSRSIGWVRAAFTTIGVEALHDTSRRSALGGSHFEKLLYDNGPAVQAVCQMPTG